MSESEVRLVESAALLPFDVVDVHEDTLAPAGSIRIRLRVEPDDLEWGALPLLFVLCALSFEEGEPGDPDDRFTTADLLAHLRYERGNLRVHLDYLRDRMLKTTIVVDPDGNIELLVVNRGSTARRWLDLLRGKKHLSLLPAEAPPVFFSSSGVALHTLEDWAAVHPPRHWRDGRSAKRLAERWSTAGDLPDEVLAAFSRAPRLSTLALQRAIVEHECAVPGRGRASVTDLMVFAQDEHQNQVIVAVEGKVDERFGPTVRDWLNEGEGADSADNRKRRLHDLAFALNIDPDDTGLLSLRYQLLHRAYAGWKTARDEGALTAVLLIHSFMAAREPRSGWDDFVAFARLLDSSASLAPGHPWAAPPVGAVSMWLVWVEGG